MSAERQARRIVRLYPRAWRSRSEDVLVGTLLDAAEADGRDRLTAGEITDVIARATVEQVRSVTLSMFWTAMVTVALTVGSTLAVVSLVLGELTPRYASNAKWVAGQAIKEQRLGEGGPFGPFPTTGVVLYLTWVALLVAICLGVTRTARGLAVFAMLLAAVVLPTAGDRGYARPPLDLLLILAGLAALVVSARWRGRAGIALVVAATATSIIVAAVWITVALPGLLDPDGGDEYVSYLFYTRLVHHFFWRTGILSSANPFVLMIAAFALAVMVCAAMVRGQALMRSLKLP